MSTESACDYDTKLVTLTAFLRSWDNLPPQRSPQWYADRMFSIGASELGTLLGLNPYQTIRKLIAQKTELSLIDDRRAMNWGNVMEHVCGAYMSIVFDCTIHETGAIPTARMRNQRSSPDGIAIIQCLGNIIVSFEFKAPARRIPRHGEIPKYYKPQVLACLCAITPSDLGLFVDTVIRRCSVADWTFTSQTYDYTYHNNVTFGNPLALCYLLFVRTVNREAMHAVVDREAKLVAGDCDVEQKNTGIVCDSTEATLPCDFPNKKDVPIDMGTCDPELLDQILADTVERKLYRVVYGKVWVDEANPPNFVDEIAGCDDIAGYLPIKIMSCVVVPVAKEPDYVLQFQPKIDTIIAAIRAIMDAPAEHRLAVFNNECNSRGWCRSSRDPI